MAILGRLALMDFIGLSHPEGVVARATWTCRDLERMTSRARSEKARNTRLLPVTKVIKLWVGLALASTTSWTTQRLASNHVGASVHPNDQIQEEPTLQRLALEPTPWDPTLASARSIRCSPAELRRDRSRRLGPVRTVATSLLSAKLQRCRWMCPVNK